MVILHHSNRLEILADRLAEVLEPHLSPFHFQTVVVGHRALESWLQNRFAKRWGICANIHYPLPARFVWNTAREILREGVPEEDPLSREALVWKVFECLPELLQDPDFAALARYLDQARGRDEQVARFDLAFQIADVFDRYQYYRPDWLERIEQGEPPRELPAWQVKLWRELIATAETHRICILREACRALYEEQVQGELPERVHWFFVHHQPPRFLDFLYELARHVEIHLWLLSPTSHYWADLRPTKVILRRRLRRPEAASVWEVGHELLAAWGREGQALQDLILDRLETAIAGEEELYRPFERHTLLGHLQADLFEIKRYGRPQPLASADGSLEIHRCHGPLREVQVLYDRLLAAFETLEDLRPEEILVLVTDIDRYAPYIEAVFGPKKAAQMPYHIVDTHLALVHPITRVFLKLLELPESRLTRSEVLSLLEVELIGRRFQLKGEALDHLRSWLEEARVFWGLDLDHRRQFLGEAACEENSWAHARRRLFAGFAVGEACQDDLAPVAGVAGQQAAALGAFCRFLERLDFWRRELPQARSPSEWQRCLNQLLDDFFGEEARDPAGQLQWIRDLVSKLARLSHATLDLELVRHWLQKVLSETEQRDRFFRDGVTFCGLRPLRGVPFRVIALLGMNEADFPRREQHREFDLMRERWRHGDPHVGHEDRYLFLETLLAAREKLLIFYNGRDVRTDELKPPSLLVEQLLDELDRSYRIAGKKPSEVIVYDHPLQPFSRRNYRSFAPESYDRLWFRVTKAILPPRTPVVRWPKLEPLERWDGCQDIRQSREVLFSSELERFLSHPLRLLVQRRWRIFLEETTAPEDHEPLEADALLRYRLTKKLLEAKMEGGELTSRRLRQEGFLPHGGLGEALYREVLEEAEHLWSQLPEETDFKPLWGEESVTSKTLLEYRLRGRWREGVVAIEPAKFRGYHLLKLYLNHLLFLLHEKRLEGKSLLILRDKRLQLKTAFKELSEIEAELGRWIELYRQGLQRPLLFLPEASWAYAEKLHRSGDPQKAKQEALKRLRAPESRDVNDPYLRLFLPEEPAGIVEDPNFAETAKTFFARPLEFTSW